MSTISSGGGHPHSFQDIRIVGADHVAKDDLIITKKNKNTGDIEEIEVVHGGWFSRQISKLSAKIKTDKNHTIEFGRSKLGDSLSRNITLVIDIQRQASNEITELSKGTAESHREIKDDLEESVKKLDIINNIFNGYAKTQFMINGWKMSLCRLSEAYTVVEKLNTLNTTTDPETYLQTLISLKKILKRNPKLIDEANLSYTTASEIKEKINELSNETIATEKLKSLMNNKDDDSYLIVASNLLQTLKTGYWDEGDLPSNNNQIKNFEETAKIIESAIDERRIKRIYLEKQYENATGLPTFEGTHLENDIKRAVDMREVVEAYKSNDLRKLAKNISELDRRTLIAYQDYIGSCVQKFVDHGTNLITIAKELKNPSETTNENDVNNYYEHIEKLQELYNLTENLIDNDLDPTKEIKPLRRTIDKLIQELLQSEKNSLKNETQSALNTLKEELFTYENQTGQFTDFHSVTQEAHSSSLDDLSRLLEDEELINAIETYKDKNNTKNKSLTLLTAILKNKNQNPDYDEKRTQIENYALTNFKINLKNSQNIIEIIKLKQIKDLIENLIETEQKDATLNFFNAKKEEFEAFLHLDLYQLQQLLKNQNISETIDTYEKAINEAQKYSNDPEKLKQFMNSAQTALLIRQAIAEKASPQRNFVTMSDRLKHRENFVTYVTKLSNVVRDYHQANLAKSSISSTDIQAHKGLIADYRGKIQALERYRAALQSSEALTLQSLKTIRMQVLTSQHINL